MTDVDRFLPGTKGLERDIVTLEARLEHEGIAFLSMTLGTLGKALERGLSEGTFAIPVGLKHAKGEKIPLLLGGIFCKVFDPVTGELVRGVNLTTEISLLRQLLFFLEEVYPVHRFGREA